MHTNTANAENITFKYCDIPSENYDKMIVYLLWGEKKDLIEHSGCLLLRKINFKDWLTNQFLKFIFKGIQKESKFYTCYGKSCLSEQTCQ